MDPVQIGKDIGQYVSEFYHSNSEVIKFTVITPVIITVTTFVSDYLAKKTAELYLNLKDRKLARTLREDIIQSQRIDYRSMPAALALVRQASDEYFLRP